MGIKKITWKDIVVLQGIIMIYSVSSVIAKFASGPDFPSVKFFLLYGLEIGVLGIYAICWQQAIKKFELSVAYANRAMVTLWAMVWAVLIFGERITWKNLAGVALIIAGTVIINREDKENE